MDRIAGRTLIYCGDKLGGCDFSKTKSSGHPHPGLPVKVVDEEIYHRPPTMMIATVDKFAMMAWRPEFGTFSARSIMSADVTACCGLVTTVAPGTEHEVHIRPPV